jgi:TolB protein
MDSDGANQRQLTTLGGANFAPFLHPDNETVIFCSNYEDTTGGRKFELYTMPLSGGAPEQVTFGGEFDGFPMFSPDGKYLAWCSNRNGSRSRETNVFVAEWVK